MFASCVGWYNTEFRDFVVGLIWCGGCFLGFVGFLDLLLAVWFGDLFPRCWFGVDCWCCACLDWLLSWVCCACFGFVRLGFRFDYGLRCGFWICCGFYFVVFGFWLRLLLFGVVVVFLVLGVCCGAVLVYLGRSTVDCVTVGSVGFLFGVGFEL